MMQIHGESAFGMTVFRIDRNGRTGTGVGPIIRSGSHAGVACKSGGCGYNIGSTECCDKSDSDEYFLNHSEMP